MSPSVTAATLDNRLRLARCTDGLHVQMPPGAALQSRTLVGVGCQGPVHWTVYVSVTVESQISVLVLKHPVPRGRHVSTADDVTVRAAQGDGSDHRLFDGPQRPSRALGAIVLWPWVRL